MTPTSLRVGAPRPQSPSLSPPPPGLEGPRPPPSWPGQVDDFSAAPPPNAAQMEQLSVAELQRLRQHTFIRLGNRGEQVRQLQQLLGLEESGQFDAATEAAVITYQRKNGLRADGLVGQQTWGSLLGIARVLPGTWHLAANIYVTVDSYKDRGKLNQMMLGTITVNGHTYKYRNGGHNRGSAPLGDYEVTPHLWSRSEPPYVVDGVGWSFAVSDKWDPRVGDTRTELRIHPDGAPDGTSGCFGIIGNGTVQKQFREDMRTMFTDFGDTLAMRVG